MSAGVRFASAMLAVGLAAGCSLEGNTSPEAELPPLASADQLDAAYADMPWILPEVTESGAALDILPAKLPKLSKAAEKKVLGAIALVGGENAEGNQVYGSGILFDDPEQGPSVITAGHVMRSIVPETLEIRDNNNELIDPAGYAADYFRPGEDEINANREDIALIRLEDPAKYAGRALAGRNVETEPVLPGEALFTRNYQDEHQPGNPASYTVIAARSGAEGTRSNSNDEDGFIMYVNDVMPKQKDDGLTPGGSGGGLVDSEARVVGINSSTSKADFAFGCGENIPADTPKDIKPYRQANSVHVVLHDEMPGADECNTGLLLSWARSINDGRFTPKDNENVKTLRVRYE